MELVEVVLEEGGDVDGVVLGTVVGGEVVVERRVVGGAVTMVVLTVGAVVAADPTVDAEVLLPRRTVVGAPIEVDDPVEATDAEATATSKVPPETTAP